MPNQRRRVNGARQQTGPQEESPFINLPWTQIQDEAFELWVAADSTLDELSMLEALFGDSLSVKMGQKNGAFFCTIESELARGKGLKPLLSGWSDDWRDALFVAYFKWDQLLGRDFAHPTQEVIRSRRR